MCGVWVESVDPVADLCPTNQFLYRTVRTVQPASIDLVLLVVNNNSRYEEITVITDTSHTKYILANIFLSSSCSK